jgi:hypothetical protein
MINNWDILDNFGVPDIVTQADVEYVLHKLARSQSSKVAEKHQSQLCSLKERLEQQHRDLVKRTYRKTK